MRIGVVAPAKPIDGTIAAQVLAYAAMAYPSVELVFHPQCYLTDGGHFAGDDKARADAFLEFANDPAFGAIWFARGGYGSNRILARVTPNLAPAARAKMYLGYSDMGFLLGALYAARIGQPVHGPMPVEIMRDGGGACIGRSLGWLAGRDKAGLEPSLVASGKPAAAFNLAILAAMVGTPWLPDLADHVLMIEDTGEPLYRTDRMLFQMANATQLKGIAGVRLGRISDIKDNDPPWNQPLADMIARWCKDMGVPMLGAADIGHDCANRVVPFGVV